MRPFTKRAEFIASDVLWRARGLFQPEAMGKGPSLGAWGVESALVLLLAGAWFLSLVGPPAPGGTGLDQSWRVAISDAGPRGLIFGRDVIFTFGPLGWLVAGIPMPSRSLAFLTFQTASVIGIIWATLELLRSRFSLAQRAIAAGALFLATVYNHSIDYYFFYACLLPLGTRYFRMKSQWPALGLLYGVLSALGFMTKSTSGADIMAAALAFFVIEGLLGVRRERVAAAMAVILLLFATGVTLLCAFDGSLSNTTTYVVNSLGIAAGYSEAMSGGGDALARAVPIAELIALAGISFVLFRQHRRGLAAALVIVAILAWKHGFVREDGHILYYFSTVTVCFVIAATNLRGSSKSTGWAMALISAIIWFSTAHFVLNFVLGPIVSTERFGQVITYLGDPVSYDTQSATQTSVNLAPDRFSTSISHGIGNRTVEVEPWESAAIQANPVRWQPEPALQAYVAYTALADDIDRREVAVRGADRILFGWGSIDGRYPLADQPSTQNEIACRYGVDITPDDAVNVTTVNATPAMLLDRLSSDHCVQSALSRVDRVTFGDRVAVPQPRLRDGSSFVRAFIDIRPTILGKLVTYAYRSPAVNLTLYEDGGTQHTWRIIPSTSGDGMIVNPEPLTFDDLTAFFAYRLQPNVRALSIDTAHRAYYAIYGIVFTDVARGRGGTK